jgi:hypothetical protein
MQCDLMVRLNFEQMTKNEIVKLKLIAKTNDFIFFNRHQGLL